jgi:hypothetical protein
MLVPMTHATRASRRAPASLAVVVALMLDALAFATHAAGAQDDNPRVRARWTRGDAAFEQSRRQPTRVSSRVPTIDLGLKSGRGSFA